MSSRADRGCVVAGRGGAFFVDMAGQKREEGEEREHELGEDMDVIAVVDGTQKWTREKGVSSNQNGQLSARVRRSTRASEQGFCTTPSNEALVLLFNG